MANHISHASLPYPIKNARFTVQVPYLDADGDPTDPTTPDTELSQDGGAFADAAEEMTTISGSNGVGYITLSGAETNNSAVAGAAKVASGPKATLFTLYPRNLPILASGTASAGAAGSITLASSITYDITGCFVRTTGGTGGGGTGGANNQARRITAYNTSTQVATVTPNWETTPDGTTTYDVLLPEGVTIQQVKTLNPTTAGRTLDVSSGGEAGIDWANLGSPSTSNNLSATTVNLVNTVTTLTSLPAITTDWLTATGTAASFWTEARTSLYGQDVVAQYDASGYAKISDGTGTGQVGLTGGAIDTVLALTANNDKTGYRLSATGVDDVWDEAQSSHTTAGTFGKYLDDEISDVLHPTVSGRTLDVTATGAAGIDWGNVENQGTAVNITNTNINQVAALSTNAVEDLLGYDLSTYAPAIGDYGFYIQQIESYVDSIPTDVWAAGTRTLTALGFTLGSSDFGTDWFTSTGLAASAVAEIQSGMATAAAVSTLQTSVNTIDDYIDTEVAAILAAVDTEVAAIKAKTDQLTFTNTNKLDAALLAANDIAAAVCNKVADHGRRRTQANVEASSDGDAIDLHSLYGLIQMAQEANTVDNPGFLTAYRTNGTSELGQIALTTDPAAEPVVGAA